MPDRYLKDSFKTSENINSLTIEARYHVVMLLLCADSWGCFDSNPYIIKGECYHSLQDVTIDIIDKWTELVEDAGVIGLYEARGKRYGHFLMFDFHNDLSNRSVSKYPCPPWLLDDKGNDTRLPSGVTERYQAIGNAVESLLKQGEKPTYKKISKIVGCSNRDVQQFLKYKNITRLEDATKELPSVTTALPEITSVTTEIEKEKEIEKGKREADEADYRALFSFELDIVELYSQYFPAPQYPQLLNPSETYLGRTVLRQIRFRRLEMKWGEEISPWGDFFKTVQQSYFLSQKMRGFSLDWITRPENFEKILIGNYTDGKGRQGGRGVSADRISQEDLDRYPD